MDVLRRMILALALVALLSGCDLLKTDGGGGGDDGGDGSDQAVLVVPARHYVA